MVIIHDPATVKAFADDGVVMAKGRIVEQRPKLRVFAPLHEPCTAPAAWAAT